MRRSAVIAAGLAAVAVAGCSSSGSGSSSPSASSSAASPTGTITVFAASSLMGTFTQLGQQFDAAHPGDTVKFSFGPSSGLATQITSGAPADVFASASPKNMDAVVTAGDAASPQDFAKNTMEVAVVKPVTLQPDVKSVLSQVELGSVDAGVVYVTDVMAAGAKVKGVTIPASDNASTLYPIATISNSKHKSIAQAFVAYVLSPAGQQVLTAAGFEKP